MTVLMTVLLASLQPLLLDKMFIFCSYRSLVQTNDHLLKELDETRQRHQHEVEQLNWSYNQLKKTLTDNTMTRNYSQPSNHKGESNASVVMYDSEN